ncbi:hypothetical protein K501DRAFT_182662 [Backusella circina FSU 941]|nr:hypothetical protein K501DRAFT_182662 [Backusella circina FSU 941]
MNILELPYELICNIISFLNVESVESFVQINRRLYDISKDDLFWAGLCRAQGIQYCLPESTWKSLFSSGNLFNMCSHMSPRELYSSIPENKELLWTNIHEYLKDRDHSIQSYSMCLHKNCDHYAENDEKHYSNTGHSLSIKISPFNIIEMWCYSCKKVIGFDNFTLNTNYHIKTEQYVMREITKGLVFMDTNEQLYTRIVSSRRKIELGLFKLQMRQFNCHIVEKDWYDKWFDFITEKADVVPGPLTNQKLVQQDGTLNPLLELGKDFELVGNLTRWYLERVYGTYDPLFSTKYIENSKSYCKLIHSIKVRHQMTQVARYPFN